ncbi:hypothetical protein R3P38DRAFT_3245860 [Favolaschia claudopus]|uniref:MYND-type domain-containing protein n=1 Tax=Favolaschia claudopus TaxID=2862362 RepID=A0AAV9YZU5_9AGAR
MHPALHLDNLKRLPPAIRSAATAFISAAPNPDRAFESIRVVREYAATPKPENKRALVVPALYIILDPLKIPDLDSLPTKSVSDAPPSDFELSITKAIFALEALYQLRLPDSLGVDLWPRILAWVQFLHLYNPGKLGAADRHPSLFTDSILFACQFLGHTPTFQLMISTPWFWFMLGRAWVYATKIQDPENRVHAFNIISCFTRIENVTETCNMDELLNGVGGTLSSLARLVVEFLDALILDHDKSDSVLPENLYISFVGGVIVFLGHVDPNLRATTLERTSLGRLGQELLAQPVFGVLFRLLSSLTKTDARGTLAALQHLLMLICVLLYSKPGWAQLPAAVKSGFIPALLLCARSTFAPHLAGHLQTCFQIILPPALISHALLSTLDTRWHEIETSAKGITFQIPDFWTEFSSLVNERLQVLHTFDSVYTAMRACDNLECSTLDVKKKFRRCSSCQSFYYCSSECQRADWTRGGHRNACCSYGTLLLGERNNDDCSSRQRSFLRALIHHDYQKQRIHIHSRQAMFLSEFPHGTFLTLYNYMEGAVRISVKEAPQSFEALAGPEWKDILSRAAASGGRMGIDVAIFTANGPTQSRYLVIPLRSDSGVITDKLASLASTLTPSTYQARQSQAMYLVKTISHIHETNDLHVAEIH